MTNWQNDGTGKWTRKVGVFSLYAQRKGLAQWVWGIYYEQVAGGPIYLIEGLGPDGHALSNAQTTMRKADAALDDIIDAVLVDSGRKETP